MSDQKQKIQVRAEIQELHRLLVELRARMGFKAYAPLRTEPIARLMRKKLKPLVEEAGRKEAPREVDRLTEQVLDRIDELIHSGEGYALYMLYLKRLFQAALKAEREACKSVGLEDDSEDFKGEYVIDLNLDEEDQADLGELPDSADRATVREHYETLRGSLQGPELDIVDVWIAERGERGWPTRLAEKIHQGEKEIGRKDLRDLKQIQSLVFRLWYKVLDAIDRVFGEWLRVEAAHKGKEEERQLLENKTKLAEAVLTLIVTHIKPHDTEAAVVSVQGAAADGAKSVSPFTLKHEQRRWLREQRQAPRMRERAQLSLDPSLLKILDAYRTNKSNTDLMKEIYGSSDAEDRFNKDLDLLHKWYEEITRDALQVIDDWSFYERRMLRKMGLKQFWEMRHQLPNFKELYEPILKVAEKKVPFSYLPDQMGIEWEELAARVRSLRENLKRRNKSQDNPSLGD